MTHVLRRKRKWRYKRVTIIRNTGIYNFLLGIGFDEYTESEAEGHSA